MTYKIYLLVCKTKYWGATPSEPAKQISVTDTLLKAAMAAPRVFVLLNSDLRISQLAQVGAQVLKRSEVLVQLPGHGKEGHLTDG